MSLLLKIMYTLKNIKKTNENSVINLTTVKVWATRKDIFLKRTF